MFPCTAHEMTPLKAAENPPGGSAGLPAVATAQNRMAAQGRLHPQLVHASGLRPQFQESFAVESIEYRVVEIRSFRVRLPFGSPFHSGFVRDFPQPVFPRAALRRHGPSHAGPVDFSNPALFELGVHTPRGLGVPREDHDARDRPVEPVWDAEVDARRLGIFRFDVMFDEAFEVRDSRRGLRKQRGRFVDRDEVVIFKQNAGRIEGLQSGIVSIGRSGPVFGSSGSARGSNLRFGARAPAEFRIIVVSRFQQPRKSVLQVSSGIVATEVSSAGARHDSQPPGSISSRNRESVRCGRIIRAFRRHALQRSRRPDDVRPKRRLEARDSR